MKNKLYIRRIIALVIALVMLFSLAVVDGKIGTLAETGGGSTPGLTATPTSASLDLSIEAELSSGYDTSTICDMSNYIYAKDGESVPISLTVYGDDGVTEADAADIKEVAYSLNGDTAVEISPDADGKYSITLTEAGEYEFTVTDINDYAGTSDTVTIMYSTSIAFDVSVDSDSDMELDASDLITHLLNDSGKTIALTVDATRNSIGKNDSGDDIYPSLILQYKLGDGSWQNITMTDASSNGNYTGTIYIPASSTQGSDYKVYIRVRDEKLSSVYTYTVDSSSGAYVFIDSSAPVINISNISINDGETTYTSLSEYTAVWCNSISFDATATEDYSRIVFTGITIKDSSGDIVYEDSVKDLAVYSYDLYKAFKSGINKLTDGKYTITFSATNYLGEESEKNMTIKLDNTNPVIAVTGDSGKIAAGDTYYITAEEGEKLSFKSTDSDSGISYIKVTVDGTEKELDNGTLLFDEPGTYTVYVETQDNAANEASMEFTVIVDNEDPVTDISVYSDGEKLNVSGSSLVYVNGSDVKVVYTVSGYKIAKKDVSAKASLVAAGSSKSTSVSADSIDTSNEDIIIYTYELSTNGTYTFNFSASRHYDTTADSVDNSITIVYDTGDPSITDVEFSNYITYKNGVYYYKTYPTVKFTATDNLALGSYVVKDEDGNTIIKGNIGSSGEYITEFEKTFTAKDGIEENRIYSIVFYASDLSGNSYNTMDSGYEYKFAIDTCSPSDISVDATSDGKLSPYWNKSDVTIQTNCSGDNFYLTSIKAVATCDGESLSDQTTKFNGSIGDSGSASFTYTEEGVYEVIVYAYDEVGNEISTKVSFVIDKSLPVITFTGIPENGIYENSSDSPITVKVTDEYGISADDVVITIYMETYDGTSKKVTIAAENTNSKTVSATINNCEIIDGKPMKYYITVSATDKSGNAASDKSKTFYYDKTIPEMSISPDIAGSDTVYYNKNVKFTIEVTEQFTFGTNIYILDADVYDGCKSEADYAKNAIKTFTYADKETKTFTYKVSNEDTYNWIIVAVDSFGNENASKEIDFVIDKEAPVAEVEGVPYNKLSTGTRVKITITDNEEIDSSDFTVTQYYKYYNATEYKQVELSVWPMDDNTVYASVYCGERNGKACSYYFKVTGTDKAGNPVEYTVSDSRFKVDSSLPGIDVSPLPEATNDGYYNSTVSFNLKVTEQYARNTTINITDLNKAVNGDEDESYTQEATEGTYSISRSGEGTYRLVITAEDAFGNETEETVNFIIDKTKPTTEISSVNKLNNGSVSLTFGLADNYKGKSYKLRVVRKNSSGEVVYDRTTDGSWVTASMKSTMSFSEEGDYEITLSAVDKAGNESETDSVSFRIDRTAPVLSVTGVSDTQTSGCTATFTMEEAFSLTYGGLSLGSSDITVTITRRTDGEAETTMATLNTSDFSSTSSTTHVASYNFSEDGEYTITFSARDLCGNTASTVTKSFKIDKTAPELFVTAVNSLSTDVNSYDVIGGNDASTSDYVDMNIEVTETFFASNNVYISVLKDGEDVSGQYFANFNSSAVSSKGSQRFEEDGVYTIAISAEDALGNKSEEYNLVFTIDNTAPSIDATDKLTSFTSRITDDGDLLLNSTDFEDISDMGYDALWTVNDTSVFNVAVKLDGVDFVDFSDLTDGYHTISIIVTDEVGHETSDEFSFTYDGTAPRIIITGVEDDSVVREPFTLNIGLEDDEDFITGIIINGEAVDSALYEETNTYEYLVEEYGDYEILVYAEDKAGNQASTYNSTTQKAFSFQLKEEVSFTNIIIIIAAIIVLILLIVIIIVAVRRRKKKK